MEEINIIKVTDKGQISLPIQLRNSLNIEQGDKLIIMQNDNYLILRKLKREDFSDLLKHSEKVAKKLWDNKEDDIWDGI